MALTSAQMEWHQSQSDVATSCWTYWSYTSQSWDDRHAWRNHQPCSPKYLCRVSKRRASMHFYRRLCLKQCIIYLIYRCFKDAPFLPSMTLVSDIKISYRYFTPTMVGQRWPIGAEKQKHMKTLPTLSNKFAGKTQIVDSEAQDCGLNQCANAKKTPQLQKPVCT